MSGILDILNSVAATSKRTEKESILVNNAANETLRRVFKMAYDKQIIFFTKNPPTSRGGSGKFSLSHALDLIEENICNRRMTGHAARDYLQVIFDSLDAEDAEVVARVIKKDLRCGSTSGTANKVWKDLIDKPKFMLAQTDAKNIVYPAFSQMKEDGTRGRMIFDGEVASFISRSGNDIETHGHFDEWARRELQPGDIIDGEFVAFGDGGKRLIRQISNGIVNKAVKGTISKEEAKSLRFIAWDIDSDESYYIQRFARLQKMLNSNDPVLLIESRMVNTYEEALEHFRDARSRKMEGTILKNAGAKWQGKRTFDVVKFKAEYEAEFKVTGYKLGTGKNANRIGNLDIESACGEIVSEVGVFKDFPETIRNDWMTDMPKIVTVRYNERVTSKGRGTQSLFLPRVISARWDKDEADTLVQIEEMERNTL